MEDDAVAAQQCDKKEHLLINQLNQPGIPFYVSRVLNVQQKYIVCVYVRNW